MLITTGVNAGLCVQTGDARIWIDVLHDEPVTGFSTVTPKRLEEILHHPKFTAPDLIFYTHLHPDHCSVRQTQEALRLWPDAIVAATFEMEKSQVVLSCQQESLYVNQTHLRFFRLPHQAPHEKCVHYGALIEDGRKRLLIAGDCAVAAPQLGAVAEEIGPVDAVVLPFLWAISSVGRNFINEYFPDSYHLINHLPLAEDDLYRYRIKTENGLPQIRPAAMLPECFMSVTI